VPKAEPPRTVFRQVVDTLGAAVLRGEYSDGPLPVEADLAASLGVGRNLLREAIKVLASKGLVAVGPKIGTRALPRSEWNLLDPDVLLWRPELVVDRDLVFHQAIHNASHNALLASIGWRLGTLMRRQVLTTTDYPGAFERGLPLHKELAEAIAARDAAWAEEVAFRLVVMPYEDLAGRLNVPAAGRLGAENGR
jgi:DNA-binding FadR family transcriptional regulator